MRIAMAREAHNKQEKIRLEERRRSDRKEAFRCSKCAAERRRPDQMSRAANGGLCCAWGADEFAALEKERGYVSPPRKNPNDYTDAPRVAPRPTREQRFPELRYMTSTQKAREDAKAAANTYGWNRRRRGSVDLEPKLVTGYVNNPGAGTNILGTAPVPAQPKYENIGIDYTLWSQMQDVKLGAHGRIPPPPEKPLPVRPLQVKQKKGRSPVSPLNPQSQAKGKQNLRRQSSIMNRELHALIEDTMLDFQPVAKPRYRY